MNFEFIDEINKVGNFFHDLERCQTVSLDTETTGLDPHTSTLLLLQMALDDNIYVFDTRKLGDRFVTYLLSLVKDSRKLCIGHNIKFDLKILYNKTGEMLENVYDTMLGDMLIHNGLNRGFYPSLDDLVGNTFMANLNKDIRKTFIDFKGELTNSQIMYSADDVKYLKKLMEIQNKKLESQGQLRTKELEMGLVSAIAKMEYYGVLLDKNLWLANLVNSVENQKKEKDTILDLIMDSVDFSKYSTAQDLVNAFAITKDYDNKSTKTKRMQAILEDLRGEFIEDWFRKSFNLSSPNQLKLALELSGINVENTNEKTLKKFGDKELIKHILEFRGYNKLISTYGESFLDYINPATGYIHTEYNQLGAATGRLSSENPNLQNQPRLKEFRRCYKARPGYKLITVDYSQVELRVLAKISRDPELISAFILGQDPHAKTATFLFNKPIDQITSEERHDGKTLNFAVVYGTTEYGLLFNFGIPLEKGRQYLKSFYDGYKVLKAFKNKSEGIIWDNKYTTTAFGRKRYFEDKILYRDNFERERYISSTQREGFNTIIQGTTADIVKISQLNIDRNNPFGIDNCRMLLQVHDELVVEAKENIVEDAERFVCDTMLKVEQDFLGDTLPAKLDSHIADYWSKD